MVKLINLAFFISQMGFFAWAEECRLNKEQLEQISQAVVCESSENLNNCKSVLGLLSENKIGERVGNRLGSQAARKMWGGININEANSNLLLKEQYDPLLKSAEKDIEDQIAEHQRVKPEFLTNETRKSQIVFDRRLALLNETGFPDESFKKYADTYARETDPEKKAHWARKIEQEHFSKLRQEFGDSPGIKKFEARQSYTDTLYKQLEEAVTSKKKISLDDKQIFLNAGFRESEIDSVNKHIELKTDPSKDYKLKKLNELKAEMKKLHYQVGQRAPSLEQAKRLQDLAAKDYGTISSKTRSMAHAMVPVINTTGSMNARRAYHAGLSGARWAVGKAGTRVASHFVNAPAAVAYDVYDVSSMAYYYKSHKDCLKGSPYVDCDDKGRPVLEVTPKTKDFLGLDWEDQKKELDADPNLCFKMSSVFKTYVEPKRGVKCSDEGFEIDQPAGYTSSVNIRTKTSPTGELRETIWDVKGPEKDVLPKGGFYISYQNGIPEQVRYKKLDLGTSLKRKTGLLNNEKLEQRISNYNDPTYYSEYPVGQKLRSGSPIDYVGGTLNATQHQQRLMVEVGMCCGSSRSEVGEKRCRALGVNSAQGRMGYDAGGNR